MPKPIGFSRGGLADIPAAALPPSRTRGLFEAQIGAARIPAGWSAPLAVGLVVYGICVFGARALLNDGDTLSHIVIGQWIIDHWAIPFRDRFSYTFANRRWVPQEWLAEIILAVAYGRLQWAGVVAITASAASAAFILLTRALARPLGSRRAAIAAFAAFAVTEAHLLARPHVLAWPLLVLWMTQIIRARDEGRVPSLLLLPVMTLWCNLHAGFVVGLGIAGLLAVEAVIEAPAEHRVREAGRWGVFLALATTSALISPNGISLFLLPLKILGMHFASSSISEWHAVDFGHFDPIEAWVLLTILAGLSSGIRLPLSRILMVLLLLYEAFAHVRNEELLGIIAPLLVAAPLAKELAPVSLQPPPVVSRRGGRRVVPAFCTAALLTIFLAGGFIATSIVLDRRGIEPPGTVAPVAAVGAIRSKGMTGHVLNSIRFGGYLMLEGIPTFIDGRADLFGDRFLLDYAAATSAIGNGLPDLLERYKVAWAIFEPLSPAVTLLSHLPGWERFYADRYAVVFRRKAAGPHSQKGGE